MRRVFSGERHRFSRRRTGYSHPAPPGTSELNPVTGPTADKCRTGPGSYPAPCQIAELVTLGEVVERAVDDAAALE